MKNLKNEQGRSMVEMLGVLAIIGVLTIIGVAGFRYAMNKHYANQTVNRLMKRAVVVAAQANFGQNLSLHEFDENDGEYKITLLDPTNNESFTMQVEDIPQEVCQQILGMDWKLAKMNPDNCSEETINFMFLNELTDCSTCVPDSVDCSQYGTECGKCSVVKGFTRDDTACTDDTERYCVMGTCSKCEPGYFVNSSNGCTACGKTARANADQANRCLGQNVYGHIGAWQMVSCDANRDDIWTDDGTTCKACPQRCYDPNNNRCRPAWEGWPYDRDKNGECICRDGYFLNTGHTCTACGNTASANADQANRCLGQNVYGHIGAWQMVSCDANRDDIWTDDGTTCKACPQRCYDPQANKCYRAWEGQAHQRVSDEDGTCQQ